MLFAEAILVFHVVLSVAMGAERTAVHKHIQRVGPPDPWPHILMLAIIIVGMIASYLVPKLRKKTKPKQKKKKKLF